MWDTVWHILVLILLIRAGDPHRIVVVTKPDERVEWSPPEAPR